MDQVEEVLSKVDIVELINERSALKKTGRNFRTNCPFHSEKTPSFIVSPERQIFKCFGCGIGGNAYKFLMEYEKMDFGEALRFLADRVGVKLKSYQPNSEETKRRRLYEINHLAAEAYHFLLTEHRAGKMARDYLANRGVSQEMIAEFSLGYAPNRYEFLAKFLVEKKGFSFEEVEASGLVFKNQRGKLTDRFRGRIMFPLYDHRDNIVGFSGRIIIPQDDVGKYINTPETAIYHKSQLLFGFNKVKEFLRKTKQVVIVEGEFDMISPYQVGIKNIVAIKGSALTEEQIRLLSRYVEELVLALDADSAGDAAARRGIQLAVNEGLNVKVVDLGKFKDPDEAARTDSNYLKKQIKEARSIFDFYLQSALERFDTNTAWGKKKAVDEVAQILAGIEDEILQSHYVGVLTNKLKVNQEAIWERLRRSGSSSDEGQGRYQPPLQQPRKNRRQVLLDYLFTLCFQEKRHQDLIDLEIKSLVANPGLERIIDLLEKYLANNKHFDSQKFASDLPEELLSIFNNFFTYPLPEKLADPQFQEKEINQVKQELRLIDLEERKSKLSAQVRQAEEAGQEKEVEEFSSQVDEIGRKIKQLT